MGLTDWTVIKTWVKYLLVCVPIIGICLMIMGIIYLRGQINTLEAKNKALQGIIDTPKQTVINKPSIKVTKKTTYVPPYGESMPNDQTYEEYVNSLGTITEETTEINLGQSLEPKIDELIDYDEEVVDSKIDPTLKPYIGLCLSRTGKSINLGITKCYKWINLGISFNVYESAW